MRDYYYCYDDVDDDDDDDFWHSSNYSRCPSWMLKIFKKRRT